MKASIMVLAALMVVSAAPARAARGDMRIDLQLGGLVPTGEYRRSANPGFEGRWVGTYMESDHAGISLDVAYHRWNASDDLNAYTADVFGPGSEVSYDAVQVAPHLVYDFRTGGKVRPYDQAPQAMV